MEITKIMLFTMSACPLGRTMKHVLQEVTTSLPDLTFSIIFIDLEPDVTNEFEVTKNPTTVFINNKGLEVTRIEGFLEIEEVIKVIKNANTVESSIEKRNVIKKEENIEYYRIYLVHGDKLVPIEVKYNNPTAVLTPRITAVNLLLQANNEHYINPFPPNATLELIEFENDLARVFIIHKEDVTSIDQIKDMERCLLQTLDFFGIDKIELILNKNALLNE